jgi:hypothetical protein
MSNDDFPIDPDAPAFEREWTGELDPAIIEKIDFDRVKIRKLQGYFSQLVNAIIDRDAEVMYPEMQIALMNTFLDVATEALTQCDYEVFVANRNETLRLLGVVIAQVNLIRPTEGQLHDAPVVTIVH